MPFWQFLTNGTHVVVLLVFCMSIIYDDNDNKTAVRPQPHNWGLKTTTYDKKTKEKWQGWYDKQSWWKESTLETGASRINELENSGIKPDL